MKAPKWIQRTVAAVGRAIRTPLDAAIEVLAPTWAFKRGLARYNLETLKRHDLTHYGYNDQRAREHRYRALTVEEEVRRNRTIDLQDARNLMARNSWAVGAVRSITGNVIGRGMMLQSAVMLKSGDMTGLPDPRANSQIEEVWNEWAKGADLTGTKSISWIQRQAYSERWISNDVFIRRHIDTERRVPTALEVVGSELLSDMDDGKMIRQGIEFNRMGRPVAYYFYPSEEKKFGDPERVPASEVIHHFFPHRPGAVRGLSPMAPVAPSFEALGRYLNHELVRAGIASAFVFMHKSGGQTITGLETGDSDEESDYEGNPVININDGGGVMLHGSKDDSLEAVAPAIQSTAFEPFVRQVLRSIATGLGISYELMARDFTQTNFSSARQSHLEDRRHWEPEQTEFVNNVLLRIWEWFIEDARMAGVFPFTSRNDFPVTWTPQGWLWVDPVKEAQATMTAIEMGLDNPIDASRRMGRDFEENVRKKAAAEKLAKELGTSIKTSSSSPKPTGSMDDVDDEDEEEEDGAAPQGGRATPRAIA